MNRTITGGGTKTAVWLAQLLSDVMAAVFLATHTVVPQHCCPAKQRKMKPTVVLMCVDLLTEVTLKAKRRLACHNCVQILFSHFLSGFSQRKRKQVKFDCFKLLKQKSLFSLDLIWTHLLISPGLLIILISVNKINCTELKLKP